MPIRLPSSTSIPGQLRGWEVKVTETAAATVGQEDRDAFVRAKGHRRERLLVCRTKKQVMDTFVSEVSRCHP